MKRSEEQFITGKLENGLTYYLGRTKSPAKSADFILVNRTGSLQEEEHERGFAHFVEHLAFAGTENFPGNALTDYLTSIGVRFGTDVNAYTAMDRTVYRIASVPVEEPSVIDKILLILRDWACGVSFDPSCVEAERSVILEEGAREDNVLVRTLKYVSALEQAGSRFARRNVIGLPGIIRHCPAQALKDFYRKWYRPPFQAVIVTGDIRPEAVREKIRNVFSSVPQGEGPTEKAVYGIPDNPVPLIGRYGNIRVKTPSVRIAERFPVLVPDRFPEPGELRTEELKEELYDGLFLELFSRRLKDLAERGKTLYRVAVPTWGRICNAAKVFRLVAVPRGERFEEALAGISGDIETVHRYGVSTGEVKEAARACRLRLYKEMARNAQFAAHECARRAAEHFSRGGFWGNTDVWYRSSLEILETVSSGKMNDYIAGMFGNKNRIIVFAGSPDAARKFPPDERVLEMVRSAKASRLPRYRSSGRVLSGFRCAEAPQGWKNSGPFPDIPGAVQAELPSGCKIIWIENPAAGETVEFRGIRRGGRRAETGAGKYGAELMGLFLDRFAINGTTRSEFDRFCTEQGMKIKPALGESFDLWSGYFNKDRMEVFFEALHASMTLVKANHRFFADFKRALAEKASREQSPEEIFRDWCRRFSSGRGVVEDIPVQRLGDVTKKEAEEAYRRHFSSVAGYTFLFEGSSAFRDVQSRLTGYIADLLPEAAGPYPADEFSGFPLLTGRAVAWNRGTIRLRYAGSPDTRPAGAYQATASVRIELRGVVSPASSAPGCARFLETILQERYLKTLRRDRGGTYYTEVNCKFPPDPRRPVILTVEFETRAGREEELIRCVREELEDMARRGPAPEEMFRAKSYLERSGLRAGESQPIPRYLDKALAMLKGEVYAGGRYPDTDGRITGAAVKNFARELSGQNNISVYILFKF